MVIMVRSWAEDVLLHYWQGFTGAWKKPTDELMRQQGPLGGPPGQGVGGPALKVGSAQGAHVALKPCVRKTV